MSGFVVSNDWRALPTSSPFLMRDSASNASYASINPRYARTLYSDATTLENQGWANWSASVAKASTALAVLSAGMLAGSSLPVAAANSFSKPAMVIERPSTSRKSTQSRDIKLAALAEMMGQSVRAPWNSGDDLRYVQETISDVSSFLQIIPATVELPEVSFTDDGEVLLVWELPGGRRADLSFSSELGHGYALLKETSFVPGAEVLTASKFPTDLLNYLRS